MIFSERRFLIRSYLILAGGLMIAAVVLDFAFAKLQDRRPRDVDPWVDSTFRLIDAALLQAAPTTRSDVAQQIARQIGTGVQLLATSDISAVDDVPQALIDSANNTYYLKRSKALQLAIRVGPVAEQSAAVSSRFLPVLFYLSILIVVGLWLRPLMSDLQILTNASQKFAADYREPLRTAHQTSQLTRLAHNLDEMSARLSHLIQSQKELTAALSHEMRTPLARIRFALAVLGNQASASVQTQLHEINNDVQQMDGLIASMLDYARLDHPDLQMTWQDVALEPWFRHVLAAADTPDRDVVLAGVEEQKTARMDGRLMELALSNLVVNACRYARKQVQVSIAVIDAGYQLSVEDDGDGIPVEQRENIFKAYTRLDTSRNRDTGGYGLGLAIVARVAALHGGNAVASASAALGGARFSITWPRGARTH